MPPQHAAPWPVELQAAPASAHSGGGASVDATNNVSIGASVLVAAGAGQSSSHARRQRSLASHHV